MAGVTSEHANYEKMKRKWKKCRDTAGGSDSVKDAGTEYLPLLDSHKRKPEKYKEYLLRALFYNATGRTIVGLAGSIFQKAPTVVVSDKAKEHMKDVTLTDEPIDMFALEVTKEYLTTGRYGILVDMASEMAVVPRPYWVGYKAEDIINWRFRAMGGDQELCFVVLRETEDVINPDDEFDVAVETRYRVLRLSDEGIYTSQIYRKEKKDPRSVGLDDKWIAGPVETPLRGGTPLDFIPFALPWGIGDPPLLDLVEVNLSHYRGSADLKHGLHFTAMPTPWVAGALGNAPSEKSDKEPLHIGSGTAWMLEKDGSAGMVEFTGKGLGAIRTDLQDMQSMMATLGARLLQEPPRYAETALSVAMRHSSDYATLRTIAQIVEQLISWAMKIHSWWLSTEKLVAKMEDSLELNKIFHDQSLTADELRALLLALQSNSLSYETFYARLSDAGWTREGVSAEEEIKSIKEQPEIVGVPPALTDPARVAGGGDPKALAGGPAGPKQPVGTDERLKKGKLK